MPVNTICYTGNWQLQTDGFLAGLHVIHKNLAILKSGRLED